MIEYTDNGKYAWYDGLKFTRDDRTGYYLNATHSIRLHRCVWQNTHGCIHEGYHVHHIDKDKSNNNIDNLMAMPSAEHYKLTGEQIPQERRDWCRHNLEVNARPKANEWHGSDAGREWHKRHGIEAYSGRTEQTLICAMCGKEYKTLHRGNTRFCSNNCKSKWRRQSGVDNITLQCVYCGTDFITNKLSPSSTCSRACANRYYKYGKRQAHSKD